MTYTLYQIKAHNLMVWFTYIYCKMIIAESSVNIHILIQKPYKEKEKNLKILLMIRTLGIYSM